MGNNLRRGDVCGGVGSKWVVLVCWFWFCVFIVNFITVLILFSCRKQRLKSEKAKAVGTELILLLPGLLFTIRLPCIYEFRITVHIRKKQGKI